jgi:hypothetical protein
MLAVIDMGISFRTPSRGGCGAATSKVRFDGQPSGTLPELRTIAWKQGKTPTPKAQVPADSHGFAHPGPAHRRVLFKCPCSFRLF